jgi:hypothetical protein
MKDNVFLAHKPDSKNKAMKRIFKFYPGNFKCAIKTSGKEKIQGKTCDLCNVLT